MGDSTPQSRPPASRGRGRKTLKDKTGSLPASQNQPTSLVAQRAYELYVERGYRHGCALEEWLDAEREVLSRQPAD
jgi:hypothetical protein